MGVVAGNVTLVHTTSPKGTAIESDVRLWLQGAIVLLVLLALGSVWGFSRRKRPLAGQGSHRRRITLTLRTGPYLVIGITALGYVTYYVLAFREDTTAAVSSLTWFRVLAWLCFVSTLILPMAATPRVRRSRVSS